jgi:histidyl-tRNA synthetase
MRILDSKNPEMGNLISNAPNITDYLDTESEDHFATLTNSLEQHNISFQLNPRLVRGLDYYTKTVFEWTTDQLGSQATVCGGGRYDDLVKQLGGQDVCAVGCAIGFERLTELVEVLSKKEQNMQPKIYIVAVGDDTELHASILAEKIRDANEEYAVEINMDGGSFKQQFRKADKSGSELAIVIGEEEIQQGNLGFKPLMIDQEQTTVKEENIMEEINRFFTE